MSPCPTVPLSHCPTVPLSYPSVLLAYPRGNGSAGASPSPFGRSLARLARLALPSAPLPLCPSAPLQLRDL